MALRPLNDRVIVKRLDNERTTASGIVIPESATEKPDQGEILAVGPGKKTEDGKVLALDLKVGDKVLFGKYSGQSVKIDGEELLVIREEEIFAVIE
ncbi:co-chaperone GroES [Alcaligenes ammonioxydans]|jgi:chaperonin GroES|uniref:Co-chaperonin GroES n=1 Tax=Alcaligenes ammonioxydans TaxID=2582914 RepID=A0ABX8SVA1_9BURK|nr:co-chaperone GroES [Alcaligenes ammonioxydans]EJC62725.1 co-chaperonin GroES [Alcaligenes faecalis subsp. faecalis NCIB 8687]QBH18854.1 co-chaperone GroES [Alcaligenes faecalis]MCH1881144.1 co-chaperone GroES [Alcaligenes ammonioxydans]QXX79961.1 co-chaperone GroES [Alcaligenes ammonioxydans]WGQ34920.1 co-chaperone GroES [Alcaligenes faecalis]